jgi:ADP-ribose pyrophosphatase YjhB (NUDIX family)
VTGSAAEFLSAHVVQAEEDYRWGELRLHVTSYLCRDLPPLELITSARTVVLAADGVLVVRDPTGLHILPGGRRQAGETLEQTVRREVLEETGWVIDPPRLLGVKHFRHLGPKPAGYRYVYPDFFQVVYGAQAHRFDPGGRETDGYELGAEFQPTAVVQRLPLYPSERVFLTAALGGVPSS